MSNLSPELNQLVQESRNANLPSQADAVRILAALRVRLGEPAAFAAGRTLTSSTARLVLPKVTTVALAGIVLYGGLLFVASPNEGIAPNRAFQSSSSRAVEGAGSALAVASAAPNDTQQAAPPASSTGSTAAHSSARLPALRSPRDNLSEEVAILSRAEMELHRGKPENALTLLREHEQRFSNGLLREERIAARVQALCALGRSSDANAQETLLSPHSLHAHKSRSACGSRNQR